MTAATLRGIRHRYPGAPHDALAGVDLDVRPGEVVLLVGPSGSGKSTLLRVPPGLVPHFHGGRFAGTGRVGGLDLRSAGPAALARRAGLLFQDPEAQGVHASVIRDVAFGLQCHGVPRAEVLPEARRALARVGADHLEDRRLDRLSGGERQRVALAGVLAPRPALLLLDEPTSQLDDDGARVLAGVLRALADDGLGVVAAEHRPDRLAAVADRVLAMAGGRLGPGVVERPADATAGRPAGDPDRPPLLAGLGLRLERGGRVVLDGADVHVAAGSVTAITGGNGAGKSTLLRALAGLDRPAAGTVRLDGWDVTADPAERRYPRVALVVQDAGRHLLRERVDDEVASGLAGLGLGAAERRERTDGALAALDLVAHRGRHPRDLSVGERERVALAVALAADPAVLLLDEPTRGMDAARRDALAGLLRRRAAAGRSALVATHDPRLARSADRVLHVAGGRVLPAAAAGADGRTGEAVAP